jgi:hypothetical protein
MRKEERTTKEGLDYMKEGRSRRDDGGGGEDGGGWPAEAVVDTMMVSVGAMATAVMNVEAVEATAVGGWKRGRL